MRPRKNTSATLGRLRINPLMAGSICGIIALACVRSQPFVQLRLNEQSTVVLHQSDTKPITKAHDQRALHKVDTDLAPALARAMASENRMERENSVRDLLFAWAARDADAALEWAMAQQDTVVRSRARASICKAVAETDPRRAMSLALAHGADEDDQGGLLDCLTMQWCGKDSKTVLDWAREQPPGEWRERFLASISYVLSKSEPVAAAQLVSALEPGPQQNEAAMAVLHQWALKDPSAALKWAEGFGEPALYKRALAEISNLQALTATPHQERAEPHGPIFPTEMNLNITIK